MKEFGSYEMFDRLTWWQSKSTVTLKEYQQKWERSRAAFMRDKDHLLNFYGIRFVYDKVCHIYRRLY